jgi:hypothetical protein
MWQMPVLAGLWGGRRASPATQRSTKTHQASYVNGDTQTQSCLLCKSQAAPGTPRLLTVAVDLSRFPVGFMQADSRVGRTYGAEHRTCGCGSGCGQQVKCAEGEGEGEGEEEGEGEGASHAGLALLASATVWSWFWAVTVMRLPEAFSAIRTPSGALGLGLSSWGQPWSRSSVLTVLTVLRPFMIHAWSFCASYPARPMEKGAAGPPLGSLNERLFVDINP